MFVEVDLYKHHKRLVLGSLEAGGALQHVDNFDRRSPVLAPGCCPSMKRGDALKCRRHGFASRPSHTLNLEERKAAVLG